jgi:hypothetical protein
MEKPDYFHPGCFAREVGGMTRPQKLNVASYRLFLLLLLTCLLCPSSGWALSFLPPQSYPAPSKVNPGPEAIQGGDLNADGNLDLVTADNGFITILFGDGSGEFPQRALLATQVTNVTTQAFLDENESVELSDLNLDGLLDILVVNAPNSSGSLGNSIEIFLNNPGSPGTFPANPSKITQNMGTNPTEVRVGQLNQLVDNLKDLSLTLIMDPRLLVYTGATGGGFSPGYESTLLSQSSGESLDLGDFNEDGLIDIALVDRLRVWVFFGNGLGGFPATISLVTAPAGEHLEYDVRMRDLDGDNHLDLVVANGGIFNTLQSNASSVVILYGEGNTLPGQKVTLDVGGEVTELSINDFDGDGALDIAAALPGESGFGKVVVIRNNNTGDRRSYDTAAPLILDASGRSTMSVYSDDFNHDGRIDLAIGNEGFLPDQVPGNVTVYLNALSPVATPTPTLSPTFFPTMTATRTRTITPTRTLSPTITPTPLPTLSPDINGDGRVDPKDLKILLEQMGNTVGQ